MQPVARALAALLLTILLLAPAVVRAEPVAVVLFPGSAEVTETGTLPLTPKDGRYAATMTLPAKADAGSLRVAAADGAGLTPADVRVSTVLRTDKGRIKEVRALLDAARAERQGLADRKAAHQGAADYWRSLSSGKEPRKAADAKALADAVRDGLAAELAAASGLTRAMADKDKHIRELEAELKRLTGGGERVQQAVVTFSGPAAKQVDVRWTYRLSGAGWASRYTLNALPDQKRVDFTWNARIRQNSGIPWKNVALTLSTAQFRGGAEPPVLPPWNLRPLDVLLKRAAKAFSTEAVQMEAMDNAPAGGAPPARRQGRVFDAYDAGRVTLASGEAKRLQLAHASWKADFDYLVRPYLGPGAFTRAAVTLDEPPKLPMGEAAYLLDSALVRKGGFSLFSKQTDLFFGADPQVAVRLTPLARKSGEAGFLGSKKSRAWDWRVTVTNGKTIPVAVRMEDRIPDAGDARIKIEKRLPQAEEEEGGLAVWTFDMAPGAEHAVEYGFTATYPKDMNLDLGGR